MIKNFQGKGANFFISKNIHKPIIKIKIAIIKFLVSSKSIFTFGNSVIYTFRHLWLNENFIGLRSPRGHCWALFHKF